MIVDTHCHIDMFPSPEKYLKEKEQCNYITLGMTNLPSHFTMGIRFFESLRHSRLALGFHPQLAEKNHHEIKDFHLLMANTSYIGEIGLDFSKDYVSSKDIQLKCFETICQWLHGEDKIISVHSRKAEKDVLSKLKEHDVKNVIFHWYSGPLGLIDEILNEGYYFSINEAMTISESGRKIISRIPHNRILTESDAPFNEKSDIVSALANMGISENQVYSNFRTLVSNLKTK